MKLRRAAAALLTPLLFAGCAGANIALHSTNSPSLAGSAPQPGCADGTGSAARFNMPSGVAVDSAGNVYVADT